MADRLGSLKKDQHVHGNYAVKNKRAPIQYARGWRFEMLIGDASGSLPLKFWGGADESRVRALYESITEGGVVCITGRVNSFNDKIEISVSESDELRPLGPGEYEPSEFLPVSTKDIEAMWKELKVIMDSVKDPTLSFILKDIFKDPAFVERFKKAPAAMHLHHAWVGGLLEHLLTLAKLCEPVVRIYDGIDRDMLVSGAILHDLCKLEEYETSTTIRTTVEGVLVGHLVMGSARVLRYLDDKNLDRNTVLKLTHMVVSHHGNIDTGSPKTPSIPEAIVLAAMDAMDCSMVRTLKLREAADKDSFETYDPKESRTIYLK